jgi:hypothetical protein
MIRTDEELRLAQESIASLQRILLAARKVHDADEFRSLSEPILLELQQRQQDILEYLSRTDAVV